MEFTCLWSKDAQQKKRKRWTDGIACFSPTTGFLSVWDQTMSVKVASTRLKADEASDALKEDGDEARVGGISLQVIAKVHHRDSDDTQTSAPAVDDSSRIVSSAVSNTTQKLTPARNYVTSSTSNDAGLKPGRRSERRRRVMNSHVPGLARRESLGKRDSPCREETQNSEINDLKRATPGVRRRIGQPTVATPGGGRRARAFHAPRSAGTCIQSSSPPGTSPITEEIRPSVGRGRPDEDCGLGISPGGCDGGSGRGAVASSNAGTCSTPMPPQTPVEIDPEDLVLEWTSRKPPQPVRVGSTLARRLHPHQREGLKMLWECVVGRGGYQGRGAILADEMGLGKTATAIALCTCLLRHRRGECRKAVIVCPSSLVRNWANEFRKWCPLGGGAIAVEHAGVAATQLVGDFSIGAPARYPILIISYELYRNHGKTINDTEGLGLLIADEGHRLKNSAETKTTRALKGCPAVMRLVLTGTPMQNDLDEFFAVADFVNPGLLGDLKSFRSRYTRPIKAAWDREADSEISELAAERIQELSEITGRFVLRRTKDVIQDSLPSATEVIVFCRPSKEQLLLYEWCVANSGEVKALLNGGTVGASGAALLHGVLPLISTLRKLCNHPDLVRSHNGDTCSEQVVDSANIEGEKDHNNQNSPEDEESDVDDVAFLLDDDDGENAFRRPGCTPPMWNIPHNAAVKDAAAVAPEVSPEYETKSSGKLAVLEALLKTIRWEHPKEKVVLSSNFTSALDVLGCLAKRNGWGSLRLDGGTSPSSRQELVDRFNRAAPNDVFMFFLSAKAGGVGLNLIGANRIVLFDSDWNPATDCQAMARVWRLGQTKEVSMYRFVTTGTLEESIYQRQIFKGALYDLIQDSNDQAHSATRHGRQLRETDGRTTRRERGRRFSQEELRELFVLKTNTVCDTFDKLSRASRQAAGALNGVQNHRRSSSNTNWRYDDALEVSTLPTSRPPDHINEEASQRKVSGQDWKSYEGPESVTDEALRVALRGMSAGCSNQVLRPNVVSFVHEIKRGKGYNTI